MPPGICLPSLRREGEQRRHFLPISIEPIQLMDFVHTSGIWSRVDHSRHLAADENAPCSDTIESFFAVSMPIRIYPGAAFSTKHHANLGAMAFALAATNSGS